MAPTCPVVETNEPSHSVVEETEAAQVEKAQGPKVQPAEYEDVYMPNMDHLEDLQSQYVENLAAEVEGQFMANLVEANTHFEEYFVGQAVRFEENLDEVHAHARVEEFNTRLADCQLEEESHCEDNLDEAHSHARVEELNTNLEDCQLEEEVHMNDFPLHNEGFDGDGDAEDKEDFDQFLSLVNMCRDEQMFASFLAKLTQQHEDVVEHPDEVKPNGGIGVGTDCTRPSTLITIRKFSPIIEKLIQDARRMAEESYMLNDLANTGLMDLDSSDEEGGAKTGILVRSFKLTDDLPYFNVGDVFGDREYFREVLQQYAVMSKRPVHIKVNDNDRLRAVCRGSGGDYKWFVHLNKQSNGDYVVRTLKRDHVHTCSEVTHNKWIMSKWLGKRFTEKIKANPHIPLVAIRQCVDEQFGSTVSRMTAYKAREIALEGIYGDTSQQYKKLFYYKNELIRTHPDSSVHIHYENYRRTELKSYVSQDIYLIRAIEDWMEALCRPIIFLDACFPSGMYKGLIFTAIGVDPNNNWWPIAWAVAETESYEQWKWFLDHLDDDLELSTNGPRYVFMSDQQKVN